ncbi:MAG TPA: M15 family metallopeptidase [Geobacteraceae bacterium]|nr:M15 family metallopeptidase [Geobacteraceae bacterium]
MPPLSRLLFLALIFIIPLNAGLCPAMEVPRQVIVVVTGSWSDAAGTLYRFEKRADQWERTGEAAKVVVGENGMGWGAGSPEAGTAQPVKKEGDRKAPAGIFPLLGEMGYGACPPAAAGLPCERITEDTRCVDDPASAFYNRILKEGELGAPAAGLWKSAEQMRLPDDRYKKLVVVGYNRPKPQPGAGSCIFMHIWRAPGSATMGCTAMAEKDLDEVIGWLRADRHPALVQLPMPVYRERWQELGLPAPEMLAQAGDQPKDKDMHPALVDATGIVPGLVVDMRYATPDNFTGKRVYECNRCFLREATARKLAMAQAELKKEGFALKAWDCYRPLSVQKIFWALVPDPRYVADPAKGSKHNRGTAVDVTMVDSKGKDAAMPTRFDDFTPRAFRASNDFPPEVLKNRKTLENAMKNAGFEPLPSEWWHFDDNDWQAYEILDINICR